MNIDLIYLNQIYTTLTLHQLSVSAILLLYIIIGNQIT